MCQPSVTPGHGLHVRVERAERPAREVPEDQDDGLGTQQLRELEGLLAVGRFQGEIRGRLADVRSFIQRADLAGEQAADEHGGRGFVAGLEAPRDPGQQRGAQVVGGEVVTPPAGPPEELVQFVARQLAVPPRVHPTEQAVDEGGLLDVRVPIRPVEVPGRDPTVAVAIQPHEGGLRPLKRLAPERRGRRVDAVPAGEPLPGEARLGRTEPTVLGPHLGAPPQDGEEHPDGLRLAGVRVSLLQPVRGPGRPLGVRELFGRESEQLRLGFIPTGLAGEERRLGLVGCRGRDN
jgi:hypothetical protein